MPQKRIRDLRRRGKTKMVYARSGVAIGTTTYPTDESGIVRVKKTVDKD